MASLPDKELDRLLRGAYPAVEVSSDFTLRLWRRLMKAPFPAWWRVPVPAVTAAVSLGVVAGLWTVFSSGPAISMERLDLFGNAAHDTLAGSVLRLMEGGI